MLKISLFAAVAAVTLSAAASAEKPIVVVETGNAIRIPYDDLNLSRQRGRSALDARIRSAAKQLCIDEGVADLERVMIGRACFAQAMASVEPQLQVAVTTAQAVGDKRIVMSLRR